MNPNERQVGGTHYANEYQHWDWVEDCNMGYLEGNASKYITRHRFKGQAVEDLRKARHYVEKLRDRRVERVRQLADVVIKCHEFAAQYNDVEAEALTLLCYNRGHDRVLELIDRMMGYATADV